MLSKTGYLIHLARLFFASLLLGICSLFSHLWNSYQPLQLAIQFQRCRQTSIQISHISIWNWLKEIHFIHLLPILPFLPSRTSTKCHLHVKDNYPLNINQFIGFTRSILVMYLAYHLIRLSLFHAHYKQLQEKRQYYAHLYRQDQKSRCSNRLL
jgi:hypothetical protein